MSQGFARGAAFSNDGTLSANSQFIGTTEYAVKTYVDTQISGITPSQWTTNANDIYYTVGAIGVGVQVVEANVFDFRYLGSPVTLGYTAFGQIVGDTNGAIDVEMRNLNAGASATTDLTFVSNTATNYGGVGITSSAYSVTGYSAYPAYCTYLYSALNDVVINATTAGKTITLVTGTGNTSGIRAKASDSGFHVYGLTNYAVVCGPSSSNGALQNVSGVGTSGQVLTSNGASALPTWQNVGGTQTGGFSVSSTTASTPAAPNGTYGSISNLSSAPTANTGSGSVVTVVNSTSAVQITVATAGTISLVAGGNVDGASTSPNFGVQWYFNSVANGKPTTFLNSNGWVTPFGAVVGSGSIGAGQTIELKWAQLNGTNGKTTVFQNISVEWVWTP